LSTAMNVGTASGSRISSSTSSIVRRFLPSIVWSRHDATSQRGLLTVLEVLEEIREPLAVPTFIAVLNDDSEDLAVAARRALLVVARQDFARDTRRWTQWWERQFVARLASSGLIDALVHESQSIRRAAGEDSKRSRKSIFGYYDDLPKRDRDPGQAGTMMRDHRGPAPAYSTELAGLAPLWFTGIRNCQVGIPATLHRVRHVESPVAQAAHARLSCIEMIVTTAKRGARSYQPVRGSGAPLEVLHTRLLSDSYRRQLVVFHQAFFHPRGSSLSQVFHARWLLPSGLAAVSLFAHSDAQAASDVTQLDRLQLGWGTR